jgi:hypothetical protein
LCCAEARSVVVTQPNNKLSRILKALLKEVPAQLAAINAASMAASLAMADVNLAAIGGPGAAEAAKERLQQRLQQIQALQVGASLGVLTFVCETRYQHLRNSCQGDVVRQQ